MMPRWTNRYPHPLDRNGTANHTIPVDVDAGSFLVLIVASGAAITTPSGWTRRRQELGDLELSVYTKTATGAETTIPIVLSAPNYPARAILFEYPPGTTWGGVASQSTASNPGPPLTGLTSDPDVFFVTANSIPGSVSATPNQSLFSPAGFGLNYQAYTPFAATDGTGISVHYAEAWDSDTAASISPSFDWGTAPGGSEYRVGFWLVPGAPVEPEEPTPLGTPTVTITAENDPTTIGGSNGSIQGTIGSRDPNADRVELAYANGHGQTTGFVTANADSPTPFTITGLAAGDYTVGVRAHPAE